MTLSRVLLLHEVNQRLSAYSILVILFSGSIVFGIAPSSFAVEDSMLITGFPQMDLASEKESKSVSLDLTKLSGLRLPFIENQGQIDERAKFYADTFAGPVYVTDDSLRYTIYGETEGVVIEERFLTDLVMNPVGLEPSTTIVNYFVGDKDKWRTNVPTYNDVSLGEIWPSIDVSLRAYASNVEHLFIVMPGGDVEDIRISFDGIKNLMINEEGQLLLETELGTVAMTKPVAYQEI